MTDPRILTAAEIDEIERREQAATPGPWEHDHYYLSGAIQGAKLRELGFRGDIQDGDCSLCWHGQNAPCVKVYTDPDSGLVYHVHRFVQEQDAMDGHWWGNIVSAATQGEITGNYDYEEGGVCSTEQDAEFIASARTDIPALIATVRHERERAELAESIVAGYEREVQSCGDITDEQREHLIQCFDEAKELAREYLTQRPKEAAQS